MDNQVLEILRTFKHRSIKLADQTLDVTGSSVDLFDPIAREYAIEIETGTVTTLDASNYYTVVIEESLNGADWSETNDENLVFDVDWADDNEGILNDQNAEADTWRSIGYARDVAGVQYVRVKLVKTGSPQAEISAYVTKNKLHTTRDKGEVILGGDEK